MPNSKFRDDVNVIGMPLTEICNATYSDPRQRQLFKNIIYVGALSALLEMDPAEIEKLFSEQYQGKEALLQSNVKALQLGRDYAQQNLSCPLGLTRQARERRRQPDLRRRQQRGGAGRGLRRRDGVRVVSHHALLVARRSLHQVLPEVPRGSRHEARRATPSSRARTSSPRSASRSAPAGTARAPSPRPRAPASRS